jgi:Tol biopolymer transport system component
MFQNIIAKTKIVYPLVLGFLLALFSLVGTAWARGAVMTQLAVNSTNESHHPSPQSAISPISNFVLFSRPDGLNTTIWLLTDGITETFVVTGHHPRLSPDGRYLIYKKGNAEHARSDVYVRDLQNDTEIMVFGNDNFVVYYAWSADGSKIIYDYNCRIYSMDPDGNNRQTLVEYWPSFYCYNDSPDVNPIDGSLAWENEKVGIAVSDSDGENGLIVFEEDWAYSPRWSPDGQWLVFYWDDNAYKVRSDGSDLTRLTTFTKPGDGIWWAGTWTADGKYIVGSGIVNGVEGIYAYPADGSSIFTPILQEDGAADYFIGNVGNLNFTPGTGSNHIFLPLVLQSYSP